MLDSARAPRLLILLILGACATPRAHAPDPEKLPSNSYSDFFDALPKVPLRDRILASSYSLMRASYAEFLLDVKKLSSGNALLTEMPTALVHGDFHPLQMAWRNGGAYLDDWDTVEHAPLWRDIVRMESAAKLMAQERGLRAYPESACLDAYAARFTSARRNPSYQPISAMPKQEDDVTDFSRSPAWLNAKPESEVPAELLLDFKKWLSAQPNLAVRATDPMRHFVSGVGSYLKQKVLILDASKRLWELKQANPRAEGCASYDTLWQSLRGQGFTADMGPVHACWMWHGIIFTLLKWDLRWQQVEIEDFKTTTQLASHVRWMCERLAEFHLAGLKETEVRTWSLALKSAAPLRTRVLELSDSVFEHLRDGYRRILQEQEE